MRLDFNVLWVEDQPIHVEAQIERISQLMQQDGFHFKPILCRSIDEVRRAIATDIFTDEVDLVLVDWDLGSNLHGEDAIEAIRDQVRYKDVVFYSAQRTPDDLRRAAFEKELEGVYCASREQLV